MGVVGERLDDVGAGMDELAMQLGDQLGGLEHDLGHVRAGLQVAAAFELEQVAFGADDRSLGQSLEQSLTRCSSRHTGSLLDGSRLLYPEPHRHYERSDAIQTA